MRAVSFELNRTFTRPTEEVDPASACFNPVLWQDGTEYTISDRETEGGEFVGEFTSDFTVFTEGTNLVGGPEDLQNLVDYLGANPGLSAPGDRVDGL